jgi:PTS system nitrogen regulatory IIA component
MITIADILQPKHVELDLRASDETDAVRQVAALLKNDERMLDWPGFYDGLKSRTPCVAVSPDFEICIPHVRTNCVSAMVMSVGRSEKGVEFAKVPQKVRYIFAIGVPVALAADYLRIIGALARIFKAPSTEAALHGTASAEEFVRLLTEQELKL